MVDNDLLNVKYSVLMSVYKKENPQYLESSINSMIQQTVKPSQIVMVKDGKLTDELDDVINQYEKKYSELFTVVESSENIGLGKALNLGIRYCKYDIIARMDTDDISLPERCEKELKLLLEKPELSIVGSWVKEFSGDINNTISERRVPINHKEIYKFAKRRNPFNHPTVIYRKNSIIAVGGYSDLRYGQDYELFGRMLIEGYKAENIGESLLFFRLGDNTIKKRKNKDSIKSYINTVKKFYKMGFSSLMDVLYVQFTQMILYILPTKITRIIYSIVRKRG